MYNDGEALPTVGTLRPEIQRFAEAVDRMSRLIYSENWPPKRATFRTLYYLTHSAHGKLIDSMVDDCPICGQQCPDLTPEQGTVDVIRERAAELAVHLTVLYNLLTTSTEVVP